MAPRQRKQINKALPHGMRVRRDGYYTWTHPETGREYGLGRDRQKAIGEVKQALAVLSAQHVTLLDRISGGAQSWGEWCDEFQKILSERESADNTRRTRKSQLKRLRAAFPADRRANSITTRECSELIDTLRKAGKNRTAQALRSFMIDCFDRMKAKGWLTGDNPARVLDSVTVKVQRARLTFEVFQTLYKATSVVWLRNAMALALVAGKDRHSVRNAKFADFRDGGWWNERSKTEARVFLPFELRLHCVGLSLEDVVKQCRATDIVSRYLIHQTQRASGTSLGRPIHVDMITRAFSAELAKLGLDWGDKHPPTFHEIRSLAARLYKDQGDINPQDLLSHKDPRSTSIYTDGRGEWVKLAVPKSTV